METTSSDAVPRNPDLPEKERVEVSRIQAEVDKLRAEAGKLQFEWMEERRKASLPFWRSRVFFQVVAAVALLGPPLFFYIKEIALPIYQAENIELGLQLAEARRSFLEEQGRLTDEIAALSEQEARLSSEQEELTTARDVLETEREALIERIAELRQQYTMLAADHALEGALRRSFESKAESLGSEIEAERNAAVEAANRRAAREAELQNRILELEQELKQLSVPAVRSESKLAPGYCSITCGESSVISGNTASAPCGWCDTQNKKQCCVTCASSMLCTDPGRDGTIDLPCGSCSINL